MFNNLVKKTGKLSKKSDDYVDIWFQLFCDMSESKDAFLRFKGNCDLDSEITQKALKRIEDLYNNKVDAYVADTLEQYAQALMTELEKEGADAAVTAFNKILPMTGVDKILSEVAGDIIDGVFSEAPYAAKYNLMLTTQNAFDNAVAKLKAATPGTAGYDELVKAVRESFCYAKQERLRFFEGMAELCSKQKDLQQKRFFELNAKMVKNMSLNDTTAENTVSISEYFGEDSNIFTYLMNGETDVELWTNNY